MCTLYVKMSHSSRIPFCNDVPFFFGSFFLFLFCLFSVRAVCYAVRSFVRRAHSGHVHLDRCRLRPSGGERPPHQGRERHEGCRRPQPQASGEIFRPNVQASVGQVPNIRIFRTYRNCTMPSFLPSFVGLRLFSPFVRAQWSSEDEP